MNDVPPLIIRPRETVLLARNFAALLVWYEKALGFKIKARIDELPYANLESAGGVRIGIGSAPPEAAAIDGTVILQIETDDVSRLLREVHIHGGSVDGPHREPDQGFDFGSFRDPEGNTWWVVDPNGP